MNHFVADVLPGVALPFCVVLIQLADSYLRYLAFRQQIRREETQRLRVAFGLWAVTSFLLYAAWFRYAGIAAQTCKIALMAGWVPWLVIFMGTVRRDTLSHIFIQGMVAVWSLMLHSISSIVVVVAFADLAEANFLTAHTAIYLLLFLLLLPGECRVFHDMLPLRQFFASRPAGYYVAAMPFVVLFSHFFLWADSSLLHTWQERLSRLALPVAFFFMYKHVLLSASEFYNQQKAGLDAKRAGARIAFLEERCRLAARTQKQTAIIRHDLRHNFRILYELISKGKTEAALSHINTQTALLDTLGTPSFAKGSFLNAAISVHLWRAEQLGIKIRQKVKIPAKPFRAEQDLTLLISELLDEAIHASAREPEGARALSLALVSDGCQWLLSVGNRAGAPLPVGRDGLPLREEGSALSLFLEKYGGELDFSYADGCNKYEILWYDVERENGEEALSC